MKTNKKEINEMKMKLDYDTLIGSIFEFLFQNNLCFFIKININNNSKYFL